MISVVFGLKWVTSFFGLLLDGLIVLGFSMKTNFVAVFPQKLNWYCLNHRQIVNLKTINIPSYQNLSVIYLQSLTSMFTTEDSRD
jgi:hypothetical protein